MQAAINISKIGFFLHHGLLKKMIDFDFGLDISDYIFHTKKCLGFQCASLKHYKVS